MGTNRNFELFKNIIVFAVGSLGAKLIQFFLIPFYTVAMTTEEYGTADLIVTLISVLFPILTVGFCEAIMRFVIGNPQNRGTTIKVSVSLCFGGTLLLVLLQPLLRQIPIISSYAYLIPLYFLVHALHRMFQQYCKGIEKNKLYAADGIISAISTILFSIILIVYLDMGVEGYIYALVLSRIVSFLIIYIGCNVNTGLYKSRVDKNLTKSMFSYGLPLIPEEISWWILLMSDRYAVAFMCGTALSGIYSIAYKIPSIFNMLVTIFAQAFSITTYKIIDDTNEKNFNSEYFSKMYEMYTAITFLLAAFIILMTKPIAYVLIKEEFFISWKYTPLLLCAFAVNNLIIYYGNIFKGIKKTRAMFLSTLTGAVINIILNIILIKYFAVYGAAMATVISYLCVYLGRYLLLKKLVKMNHYFSKNSISIAIIVFMSFMYIRDNRLGFITSGCLFIILLFLYKKQVHKFINYVWNTIRCIKLGHIE